jgi:hypothetical protein
MTDENIKAELKRLGIIVGAILVIYLAVYMIESRTQFLTKMLQ